MGTTRIIICPTCGEVLEFSEAAYEKHCEEEAKVWRAHAHKVFDTFWKSGLLDRQEAYNWLADRLMVSREEMHFANLDIRQCRKAVEICLAAQEKMVEAFYGYSAEKAVNGIRNDFKQECVTLYPTAQKNG